MSKHKMHVSPNGKEYPVDDENNGVISHRQRSETGQSEYSDDVESGDENKSRGNWTGKFDFILSCVGYAVGLGNVWRFPFLCYRNGGGAFLIPYAIMLCITGVPLFYMELSFGQFGNLGPVSIWRCCPLFKGLGWAMLVMSGLVAIYYNVIIAWAIYYLCASFTKKLPWMDCSNKWNDFNCRNLMDNFTNSSNVPGNFRYNPNPTECDKDLNITSNCSVYQTPAEQYWERQVLGVVDAVSGKQQFLDEPIGTPQWHLSLCLLASWIICYVCLIKGVKSSGKVVYFTAIFPYVVMIILVIYGATLQGALGGVKFYLTPKWEKLATAKPWADAAVQIFYSLGVSFGGLQTMASYNKFKNNCYRDALIVSIVNCVTSVFAGFAIFSVLGYMALKTDLPIEKVVKEGPGFAFIAYPEGIASMPVPQLWSTLFFLMLITLGLDSQFAMVETVISGILDEFPWIVNGSFKRKAIFTAILSVALFFLGLPMVCKGGIYIFTLVDWYCAGFSLMITSFFELIAISYVYGFQNFRKDIKMMIGFLPGYWWVACWLAISPLATAFIFISSCVQYTKVSYGGYEFPDWAEALGWLMVFASVLFIPGNMLYMLIKQGLCGVCKKAAVSEDEWGPCVKQFWPEDERYAMKLDNDFKDGEKESNGYPNKSYNYDEDEPGKISSSHL